MNKKELYGQDQEPFIDIVVGISDGLVIPFALATGISRLTTDNSIVIFVVLAAIIIGAIAMALGSYFSAKQESRHDEQHELELYSKLGLEQDVVSAMSQELLQDKEQWQSLTSKHGVLPDFHADRSKLSALNVAIAYATGGLIPLTPYFFTASVTDGLEISVAVTVICLFLFGFLKAKYTNRNVWSIAFRYILTGSTAALAAYFVAGVFI